MKIIRVFPRRTSHTPTDSMAFVGDPRLDRPRADEVHISCTFTWDIPGAERLKLAWGQYYPIVKLGGPAFGDPGNKFIQGRYLKPGVTITSRGCNNHCPWCLVSSREGGIRELPIRPGRIELSNNLLQCSTTHLGMVFAMLSEQSAVELNGGLEASRVTDTIADLIRGLRLKQLFLACDTDNAIKQLRKAVKILSLPRDKVRCYVLLKYNPEETMGHARDRLIEVWEAGCLPFAQLYQPADQFIEYPWEWKRFARTWQRPAITRSLMRGKDD